MTVKQFLLLLIPSALWGSSFIFMHHLSPVFGPILTSTIRIIVGALFLAGLFAIQKYKVYWKRDYKLFMLIGITNSAIPFSLYAYAALYIPSSLSVIINSTSPMFGAVFALLLLKDRLNVTKVVGLLLGTIGVGFVSSDIFAQHSVELYLSIGACVTAALLYGLSGAFVKLYATHIEPKQLTVGSLTFAGMSMMLLVIILALVGQFPQIVSENIVLDIFLIIAFGILCTSIPYIIYYKLMKEVGPVKALTVTYLMPVFGLLWGMIFGEVITVLMIIGLVIILVGIYVLSQKEKELY
jgi:drug/metabolite transporter (DMT)-like permease